MSVCSLFGSRTGSPRRCCDRAKLGHDSAKSLKVGHVEGSFTLFRDGAHVHMYVDTCLYICVRMCTLWSKSQHGQRARSTRSECGRDLTRKVRICAVFQQHVHHYERRWWCEVCESRS